MKVFWALVLVLALAATAMFAMRGSNTGAPTSPPTAPVSTAASAAPADQSANPPAVSQKQAELPAPSQAPAEPSPAPNSGEKAAPAQNSASQVAPATPSGEAPVTSSVPSSQPSSEPKPVASSPAKEPQPSTSPESQPAAQDPQPTPSETRTESSKPEQTTPEQTKPEQTAPEPSVAPPASNPAAATIVPLPPPANARPSQPPPRNAEHTGVPPPPPEYKPSDQPAKPHTSVAQADGSLLLDDRFKLAGEGTKEKPYQVSWDLLVSASEEYSPRDGRNELPQRVRLLDGKYVEITGNIAFPLLVEEPRELLSMLNQWDGCCIGVPPTPYDAIEVKLTKTVKGPDRLTSYGVVRGKLKVEPQLVGKWLVALYAMEEGELSPKGYTGFTP